MRTNQTDKHLHERRNTSGRDPIDPPKRSALSATLWWWQRREPSFLFLHLLLFWLECNKEWARERDRNKLEVKERDCSALVSYRRTKWKKLKASKGNNQQPFSVSNCFFLWFTLFLYYSMSDPATTKDGNRRYTTYSLKKAIFYCVLIFDLMRISFLFLFFCAFNATLMVSYHWLLYLYISSY
mgnify:CR=1 FL=1